MYGVACSKHYCGKYSYEKLSTSPFRPRLLLLLLLSYLSELLRLCGAVDDDDDDDDDTRYLVNRAMLAKICMRTRCIVTYSILDQGKCTQILRSK
jgi:hypothetical protein